MEVRSHGPELVGAAAEAGLDDERPRRHGGQRPDLLGHQDRVPQRDQEQAADRAVGPFRQKATEHRHVLHVSSWAGGVVVAQGQAVEAGPIRGLGLAEDLERPFPLAARSGGAERGANGYADAHRSQCLPHRPACGLDDENRQCVLAHLLFSFPRAALEQPRAQCLNASITAAKSGHAVPSSITVDRSTSVAGPLRAGTPP